MESFLRTEVVSATKLVRQFSTYISSIAEHSLSKIAIIRNNEMEAVLISIEEYERLKKIEASRFSTKSPKNYFGSISEESACQMEEAVKECRKVDENEW